MFSLAIVENGDEMKGQERFKFMSERNACKEIQGLDK